MADYYFPLIQRRDVAEGTMAFVFDTSGQTFRFDAGQNADFTLLNPAHTDAEGNTRTFSFASSPHHTDSIMIATRMRDTAFKNTLRELLLGTPVKVSGPSGNMVLHDDASKPAVFLTGGIGITPMRSIIEWATHEKKQHELFLFYSNKMPAATAFLDDFEGWAKENPKLHVLALVTDSDDTQQGRFHKGKIDASIIRSTIPNLLQAVYYLAGPPGMVDAMKILLTDLGVSRDNIRLESFSGY